MTIMLKYIKLSMRNIIKAVSVFHIMEWCLFNVIHNKWIYRLMCTYNSVRFIFSSNKWYETMIIDFIHNQH